MIFWRGRWNFPDVLDDIEGLLSENRIFKQRNVDIARWCPSKRLWIGDFRALWCEALGMAWDLRRAQPYECYDEFEFQIPVGTKGDCFDRYLCRMMEMRESVKIIQQAIEKLGQCDGACAIA